MANRTVAVNFAANTAPYVAGVGRATAATSALSGAATVAIAKFLGPASLVYGLSNASKASLAFQDEMTKLQTQIGLTNPEIDEMRRAALSLGGATTKAPQELAEAAFFIASAGLRGADALDVMTASAKLSAIGLGETKVIADLLTSAVNAYGSETLSASAASDALVSAVRLGKLEAPQLSAAMGSILPVASAMGVSFSEVAGMMAAMSRTGTDAATASTQLTQIMMGLMRPSNQATEALHGLGITSEELRATIEDEGLFAALMMLHGAVDGNVQALGEIFPNIRAFKGIADLLGPGLEANAAILEEMANSTGIASDAFEGFSTTTRSELNRMSAELQRTMILVGDRTEGIVFQLSRLLTTSIRVIGDAAERAEDRAGFTARVSRDLADALRDIQQETRNLSADERQAAMDTDRMQASIRGATEAYNRLTLSQQADAFSKDVRMALLRGQIGLEEEVTNKFIAQALALASVSDEQSSVNAQVDRWNAIAGSYGVATDGATTATDLFGGSLGMTAEQLELNRNAIDAVRRAQLELVDPVYAAIEAERRYREALEAVIAVQGDAEASADDLVDAVFEVMFAEIERQATMDAAGLVTEGFIGTLNDTIEMLGLEESAVREVRDRMAELGIEMDLLDGRLTQSRHIHTIETVNVAGDAPGLGVSGRRAAGGPVSAGRAYLVGEEGPELIVPNASGMVLTAGQTQAALGGGSSWNVTVNMPPGADGEQVVSALRRWERANGPVPVGVR